jgi:hypothetical protein
MADWRDDLTGVPVSTLADLTRSIGGNDVEGFYNQLDYQNQMRNKAFDSYAQQLSEALSALGYTAVIDTTPQSAPGAYNSRGNITVPNELRVGIKEFSGVPATFIGNPLSSSIDPQTRAKQMLSNAKLYNAQQAGQSYQPEAIAQSQRQPAAAGAQTQRPAYLSPQYRPRQAFSAPGTPSPVQAAGQTSASVSSAPRYTLGDLVSAFSPNNGPSIYSQIKSRLSGRV